VKPVHIEGLFITGSDAPVHPMVAYRGSRYVAILSLETLVIGGVEWSN